MGTLIVAVVVAVIVLALVMRVLKRKRLMEKYGDAEVVRMILRHAVWQGQTAEQLADSLGRPVAVDRKVLKAKVKETWKYGQVAKNRYNVRVMLEDDVVVGWEKKG